MEIDELKIYRGEDYPINDKIKIHIPTLGEICDYGDNKYFGMVKMLTSTPSDLKWQLDQMRIDFTKIDNFTLFSQIQCYRPENMEEKDFALSKEKTKILFGDLNFFNFQIMQNQSNGEMCLFDKTTETIIDGYTHKLIADTLRKIHFLGAENIEKPANESTRLILIEDAREDFLANQNKPEHSYLLNLISAMVNSEGFKSNLDEVWNMKIYAFLDSVRRISKIKQAELLLQSGYSGYGISFKDIDKKQLDWLGDIE